MKRNKLIFTTILGALMVLLMGSAASAQYPGGGTTTTTTSTPGKPPVDVQAGQDITTTGEGCAPNTPVYIVIDGSTAADTPFPPANPATTVTSNADGTFTAVVHIPLDTTLGAHTLVAYCAAPGGGTKIQTIPINVLAATVATTTTTGGTLARTGAPNHLGSMIGIGAAALVLGASLVYGATRRKAGGTA